MLFLDVLNTASIPKFATAQEYRLYGKDRFTEKSKNKRRVFEDMCTELHLIGYRLEEQFGRCSVWDEV